MRTDFPRSACFVSRKYARSTELSGEFRRQARWSEASDQRHWREPVDAVDGEPLADFDLWELGVHGKITSFAAEVGFARTSLGTEANLSWLKSKASLACRAARSPLGLETISSRSWTGSASKRDYQAYQR